MPWPTFTISTAELENDWIQDPPLPHQNPSNSRKYPFIGIVCLKLQQNQDNRDTHLTPNHWILNKCALPATLLHISRRLGKKHFLGIQIWRKKTRE